MRRMTTSKHIFAAAALVMTTMSCLSTAGAASPTDHSRGDVFSTTTTNPSRPAPNRIPVRIEQNVVRPTTPAPWVGPRPVVTAGSSPTQWFEAVDEYVAYFRPSLADRTIVDAPFNQEVERVEQFCRTIAKISRNYRTLAKRLSSLPIPHTLPEAQQYRDLHVTWYNDQAQVFEDMVRPRKPARTKEELDATMKDLADRSEGLGNQIALLQQMDSELRKKHGVHPAKYDDALRDYYTHGVSDYTKQQIDASRR